MKKMIKNKMSWCLACIFLLLASNVHADIKLPAIIADNMVLQQNASVPLWGWADVGEEVVVSSTWNNKTVKTIADKNGRWKILIKTSKAGGPFQLSFQGKNKIQLQNVLLGEVWLCSGQSNMEFPLEQQQSWKTGVIGASEEIAQANYPNLRMFIVEKKTSAIPLDDVKGDWNICSPATAGNFSAVAYYFGKELLKKTGVPIGLIHSSWGGTPAEAWTNKQTLELDADFKPIFDRYRTALINFSKANDLYEKQLTAWEKDSVLASTNAGTVLARPVKPAAVKYYQSPAQLYNGMIHPLIPYAIKGVIWYQGESNAGRAYQYRKLFPALIKSWRKEWKINFPFYFVQIAPYKDQNPEIREAQLLSYRSVPKTGMAVITDAGDSESIHPRKKDVVGERLARWALAKDYGRKDLVYSGPLYRSYKKEGNKIRIDFDFAEGLVLTEAAGNEFTIAGTDKRFVPAQTRIDGNTILVWSNQIKDPVAVRFGWKNVPHAVLFNGAGLPASPFRTDKWKGETEGKN